MVSFGGWRAVLCCDACQDAEGMANGEAEFDELTLVVNAAGDWIKRVRTLLADGDDASLHDLNVLLNEAKDIPVAMVGGAAWNLCVAPNVSTRMCMFRGDGWCLWLRLDMLGDRLSVTCCKPSSTPVTGPPSVPRRWRAAPVCHP